MSELTFISVTLNCVRSQIFLTVHWQLLIHMKFSDPVKPLVNSNVRTTIFDTTWSINLWQWKQEYEYTHTHTHTHTHWNITQSYKKNETMPFAATRMDLEIIMLNEISQRKINTIYHLHVESKVSHKWTYLQNRNRVTDIDNRHGYQSRKGVREE